MAPPDYSAYDDLSDFEEREFEHPIAGRLTRKRVFRKGSGPGVVVMTEVPGITPQVAHLARDIADAGFSVAMPDLIGTPGRPFSQLYALRSMSRACISREFRLLSTKKRSPITDWLRALGRALHEEVGGPGIGAIGMCLTGNFALSLMLDSVLLAPVLSQPSLPLGLSSARRRGLHLAPAEVEEVSRRSQDEGIPVLALRFTHDPLVPSQRFEALRSCFGDRLETWEVDSSPGNPHGLPRTAHSVTTTDVIWEDGHVTVEARNRVIAFLRERLLKAV